MATLQKPFLATFFLDGSHGREHSGPNHEPPGTAEPIDAREWAVRLSAQNPKVVVRELAGLDDEQLLSLQAQIAARPRLPVSWWARLGSAGGLMLAAVGGLGLATNMLPAEFRLPEITVLSAAVLALGAVMTAAGWFSALRLVPVMRAYEQLGQYVRVLDEQHPWLYDALEMLQDRTAAAYQQRVLAMRGPLRGMDVSMMRYAAQAQSEVLRCWPAGDAVQRLQAPVAPSTAATTTAAQGDMASSTTFESR